MKPFSRNVYKVLSLLIFVSMLSGCFMTRKKNRCGDCPKWKIEWTEVLFK